LYNINELKSGSRQLPCPSEFLILDNIPMWKKIISILFSCKIVDSCGTIALHRLFDGKRNEIKETLKVTILQLRLEKIKK
jgi:hypothetical protein